MTGGEAPRRLRMGVPILAALAYLLVDLILLPEAPRHLAYCLSAETGLWAPTEFAHPLFVPMIAGLRALLAVFGHQGRMLFPLQVLNAAAAAAAVGLLAAMIQQASGSRSLGAAGALLFGFMKGFWLQHPRPMPYALGGLSVIVGLYWLTRPGLSDRTRALGAGAAAAAATLLTLSGLSMVPAGLILLWRDGGRRAAAFFLAAFALPLAAGFAAFLAFHDIRLGGLSFSQVFFDVEQVSGSSIWSSRSPLRQAADLLESLASNIDAELIFVCALALLAAALRRRREARPLTLLTVRDRARGCSPYARAEAVRLAAAGAVVSASFGLFFLINNTQNGFIFVVGLGLPLAAVLAAPGRPLRIALALAAGLLAARGITEGWSGRLAYGRGGADETEPAYLEGRFLERYLRAGDLVLTPNFPGPDFDYFFGFGVVQAGRSSWTRLRPSTLGLDEALALRVERSLARGRRVLLAQWTAEDTGPGEMGLYYQDTGRKEQAERVSVLNAFLGSRFRLGRPMRAPSGNWYRPLIRKADGKDSRIPVRIPGKDFFWPSGWPQDGPRFQRLRRALGDDPGDPFLYCDLAAAFWESGAREAAEECLRLAESADPGAVLYVRRLRDRLESVAAKDRGVKLYLGGDLPGAIRELDRALRLEPSQDEALISRASVRLAAGDLPGAREDLQRLIGMDGGASPLRPEARRMLAGEGIITP